MDALVESAPCPPPPPPLPRPPSPVAWRMHEHTCQLTVFVPELAPHLVELDPYAPLPNRFAMHRFAGEPHNYTQPQSFFFMWGGGGHGKRRDVFGRSDARIRTRGGRWREIVAGCDRRL